LQALSGKSGRALSGLWLPVSGANGEEMCAGALQLRVVTYRLR